MSWFERQLQGRQSEEFDQDLVRYVRASGLDQALSTLCGPFGVRRFVIRFGENGGRIRVSDLEAETLLSGGGPPPPDLTGEALAQVESSLDKLHRNMSTGPSWETGAVAVVRDAKDNVELLPLFDEDAAQARLEDLGNPTPPGHPLESPAYFQLVASHEATMSEVHAETSRIGKNWEEWEIVEDEQLVLTYTTGNKRHRCQTLGTFHPETDRFRWEVSEPLFTEDAFAWDNFSASWDAVVVLGYLASARLGASWLFVQAYDPDGSTVLAAAWD